MKFLYESVGEYPEIDDNLSHWYGGFKLWWARTKALFSWFNNCKELPKETELIKNVILGLNIKVYAYPDADRNAFVIPGFYVGADKNADELMTEYKKKYPKHDLRDPFCVGNDFFSVLMSCQLKQLILMRKFSYTNDPKRPGKKKIIFKGVTTPISVFVTYGMLNFASPEERLAIYLHEIGHWVDAALTIPSHVISHPDKESIFMASNMMYQRYCTRYQELRADKFAKDLGYGEELAKSLENFSTVRKNISWIYRFGDWLMKCAIKAQNEGEDRGDITYVDAANYPSIKTRAEYLRDKS